MTLAETLDRRAEVIDRPAHARLDHDPLQDIFRQQQQAFAQQRYPSYEQRKQNLLTLQQMLVDHQFYFSLLRVM